MAKINYTNLKLKLNNNVETIEFNGVKIDVIQYLSIDEKNNLISIALQNAEEENGLYYNPLKLDMLFHLYIVFMYTNLSFTDKQKSDPIKLYDSLKSNGLLDLILEKIPEVEYNTLYQYLEELSYTKTELKKSTAALIQSLIADLPRQAQSAMDIVNNFDPEKYQNVIDFARAANGNREIK